MSDAVRKKQGGGALFDEIGGIAAEEAGLDKSLRNVERRCKMDVSVFHSGAASLDGRAYTSACSALKSPDTGYVRVTSQS